ncbi:MAG: hypothetical protein H0X72_02495 [Acidobacteria bacterium]|nr:hypothetical protein [Acidobacteriota bacterium]
MTTRPTNQWTRGETATFLKTSLVKPGVARRRFRPRHLSRWAASLEIVWLMFLVFQQNVAIYVNLPKNLQITFKT